jgi:hypothetical protein
LNIHQHDLPEKLNFDVDLPEKLNFDVDKLSALLNEVVEFKPKKKEFIQSKQEKLKKRRKETKKRLLECVKNKAKQPTTNQTESSCIQLH